MKTITGLNHVLFVVLLLAASRVFAVTALENAYLALDNNHTRQAIQYFQLALKQAPDSIEAKVGLAKSYYLKRHIDKALPLVDQVLQTAPDNVEAIFLKAKIEYGKNNLSYSKQLLLEVVRQLPDNVEANMTLANVLNALGETGAADEIYEKFK